MSENLKQYTELVLVKNTDFEGHVKDNLMQVLVFDVVALRYGVDVAAKLFNVVEHEFTCSVHQILLTHCELQHALRVVALQ